MALILEKKGNCAKRGAPKSPGEGLYESMTTGLAVREHGEICYQQQQLLG